MDIANASQLPVLEISSPYQQKDALIQMDALHPLSGKYLIHLTNRPNPVSLEPWWRRGPLRTSNWLELYRRSIDWILR